VAVFVHTHQVGITFGRGQFGLDPDLALFIAPGLVFDFDEREAPVSALVVFGIEGHQRTLFLELLQAVYGEIAERRECPVQLGEAPDLHRQQVEFHSLGINVLADAPVLRDVFLEGVGNQVARVVDVPRLNLIEEIAEEVFVSITLERILEDDPDQFSRLCFIHARLLGLLSLLAIHHSLFPIHYSFFQRFDNRRESPPALLWTQFCPPLPDSSRPGCAYAE